MTEKKRAIISQVSLPFATLKKLELELNWLGQCRKHPEDSARIEVFARFVGKNRACVADCWIGLEYLPFLITGSSWNHGTMVGTPLSIRPFTLPIGFQSRWLVPGIGETAEIDLQAAYPLRLHHSAAAVLELLTADNELLYLPQPELIRAHYLFCPRAIPSLLGGLAQYQHLASSSLQAWHYPKTCWTDETKGIAQFHRAKFLTDYQSKCLSRLLFDPIGMDSVKRLHHWAQSSFIESNVGQQTELRADLPRLALPYPEAKWYAAVRYMGCNEDGQQRYLVLQLHSFTAPEPYRELQILCDDDPKDTSLSESSTTEPATSGGKILQPLPEDPLKLVEEEACGNFAPVFIADVLPVDRASQLRIPLKSRRSDDGRNGNKRGPATESKQVLKGSVLGPGNRDEKTAPLTPGEITDEWPTRHEDLSTPAKIITEIMLQVRECHAHLSCKVKFTFLPNEQQCYSYEVRGVRKLTSRSRRYFRQFLLVEIVIGGRCAYLVDAQQRNPSENFPIGLIRRKPDQMPNGNRLNNEDFELIAKCFEQSRRKGLSWTTHVELTNRFHLLDVRHPPRSHPSEKDLLSFKERLFQAVMLSIGDPHAHN